MIRKDRSREIMSDALRVLPGGVNSPARAFGAVGGEPLVIRRADGAKIYDVDGQEYIDFVGSWGPMILGHRHPSVVAALSEALDDGTSFGASTEKEVRFAELIVLSVPSIERVRCVNSGTEATMSAIRLARGFTGRDKIVKFEGCYHGHSDGLLVRAGSGATTLGVPDSPGVPDDVVRHTLSCRYNDLDAVESIVEAHGDEIACVIVEPVAGNMGLVPPQDGFLEGLRVLTSNRGIVLIFDEVISGFRLALGGAQELFGVTPDLTCLGKIIGGGLPVGAFGGRAEIMDRMAPSGPVYQAGTLSGNPLAMSAGLATLRQLSENRGIYARLAETTNRFCAEIDVHVSSRGLPVRLIRRGSMFCLFFRSEHVRDYDDAKGCDTEKFGRYFWSMLEQGIYLPPSQFETCFVSAAHASADLERTIEAMKRALGDVYG